ncbi:hypothetical protein [Allosphingosinicella sp.]|uniref:hypothetical protein n=1 Tax=Allosphingosinicella sp. TaxID=2823234 RepID=UPI0037830A6F
MSLRKLKLGPPADGSGSLPALETICEDCEGEGFINQRREGHVIRLGGQCNKCRGLGTTPTEDGRRLLSFLLRHWH